jgi:DNA-binding transcriptional MerR regulator
MPEHSRAKTELPPIPAKRYFTIGEVSDLCAVKPHVLRYWEQEFAQLKPVKRRGNRRYYQHHEVLLIRRIRDLLYEQGFTINGARHRLESESPTGGVDSAAPPAPWTGVERRVARQTLAPAAPASAPIDAPTATPNDAPIGAPTLADVRQELQEIRQLLGPDR